MSLATLCYDSLTAFIKINKHPTERKAQKAVHVSCSVRKKISVFFDGYAMLVQLSDRG